MDVNKLTAEIMSNPKFAEKWDGPDRVSAYQAFLNDVDFYKERISELTLTMLHERDSIEPFLTKDVVSAFNTYMATCVSFFRTKDRHDVIQQEYVGEQDEEDASASSFWSQTEQEREAEADAWQELDALCGDDGEDVPYPMADTIMMRQITLRPVHTLDKFLKYEKAETPPIILPKQKEIDLEHPDLKTKPFFPPPPLPPLPPATSLSFPLAPAILTEEASLPPPPPNTPFPPPSSPTHQVVSSVEKNVQATVTGLIDEMLASVLEHFPISEPSPSPTEAVERLSPESTLDTETLPLPVPVPANNASQKKKKQHRKQNQATTHQVLESLHVDI